MDKSLKAAVVVAALGYFVDIYDLLLFSIVRVASLTSFGLSKEQVFSEGVHLINMQMLGMLLGGILWGVLGDKRGRVSVLFGSIFLYSIANIANAYVGTVEGYAFWRFIAGLGLAGELGAGITLVTEMMPKDKRGYGTTIVATVGVSGAVFAATTASYFEWRTNYMIGGVLGLLLFALRIAVAESGMFSRIAVQNISRGSLVLLFSSLGRIKRLLLCIFCGLPIWATVGILVTFAPEIAKALNITDGVTAGKAVLYTYIGLCFGDLSSGLLCQYFKSRKKVIYGFIVCTLITSLLILNAYDYTAHSFYLLFLPLGVAIGYWAMFVTVAAEQFGTNLRATVTTSVPNFVRGSVVPFTSLFQFLHSDYGVLNSALFVVLVSIILAFFAVTQLKESFNNDLDFIES
jgi:putative MFS transporter